MRDTLKLRITVVNHTERALDISPDSRSIVVLSRSAPDGAVNSNPLYQPFRVLYSRLDAPLFGYPIAAGDWTVQASDAPPLTFGWRGSHVGPGEAFTGSKDVNGAMMILPLTVPEKEVDITVEDANVIGLAFLDVNGGILGFLDSTQWGVSARQAFEMATN
jgi:hypothetical protein